MEIWAIFVAVGIPGSITAFLFWRIQKKITDAEKERKEREIEKDECLILIIEGTNAAIRMGKANGEVLQGQKCNGNVTTAMQNADNVMEKQRAFMHRQTVKIFNETK
jgi:hypothetical protein